LEKVYTVFDVGNERIGFARLRKNSTYAYSSYGRQPSVYGREPSKYDIDYPVYGDDNSRFFT